MLRQGTCVRLHDDDDVLVVERARFNRAGTWELELVSDDRRRFSVDLSPKLFDRVQLVKCAGKVSSASVSDELELTADSLEWDSARFDRPTTVRVRPLRALVIMVSLVLVWIGVLVAPRLLTGKDDIVDTFASRATFAGSVGQGLSWVQVNGGFVARGGVAYPLSPENPSTSLLAPSGEISTLSVNWESVGSGSGVVFGYKDAGNYWAVVAVPEFGTWNLIRVESGKPTFLANSGLSRFTDVVLGLEFGPQSVSVRFDGVERVGFPIDVTVRSGFVGLIAAAGDSLWRCRSVTISLDS